MTERDASSEQSVSCMGRKEERVGGLVGEVAEEVEGSGTGGGGGGEFSHDITPVFRILHETPVSQQRPPSEEVWSHLGLGGHFLLKIAHL